MFQSGQPRDPGSRSRSPSEHRIGVPVELIECDVVAQREAGSLGKFHQVQGLGGLSGRIGGDSMAGNALSSAVAEFETNALVFGLTS